MPQTSRLEAYVVRYARWVIEHRWLVLLLSVLIVGALAAGGKNLRFSTDYRVYFGPENPQLLAFDELQNVYAKNDSILMMVEPRDGDAFAPRVLEAVREMTEEAWKLPYTLRVDSVTNFQHTEADGDDLRVAPLLGSDEDVTPAVAQRIRDIATQDVVLLHRLVSPTGHVTAVNITAQLPPADQQTQRELPEAVAAARALRERILAKYPEVKEIYMTGSNMMSTAFTEASIGDSKTLIPLMYGVIILTMVLMLRSVWATAATMLVVIVSAITALGTAGWMHILLTPPSAASPQIITTLAVADCVHIYLTYFALLRAGRAKNDAIVEALRVNFTAVFLTSATTAIGFMSVNFTDSPPLRDLANITAIGVMLAWFFASFTLPALMAVLPARVAAKGGDFEHSGLTLWMDRLANFVLKHRRATFWSVLAVGVVLTGVSFKNEGNDLFAHYFDTRIKYRTDTDHVVENLTGLYSIEYSLRCGEPECVSQPAYLAKVEAFKQYWLGHDKVLYVGSITDVFMKLNKSMNADNPAFYTLPADSALAAQYLLLYEMSLPFGLDLNNTVNQDKSSSRFTVIFEHLKSKETRAIEEGGRAWLAEHAPEMETHGVSPAVMFAHISKRNLESNFLSLPISLALISLLLAPVLRSWRLGLAFLLPNLLPMGIGFGLWALWSGEVNFTMAIVLNMTVGIIVDDTIHFITKYLRARQEQDLAPEDAIRYSFHNVGGALVVNTLILTAGFMILAQSAFLPNSGMAQLTAATIVAALIVDLTLLPAMLLKLDRTPTPKPASQELHHVPVAAE